MTPSQTSYGVYQALSCAVQLCSNGGSSISKAIKTTMMVISVGRCSGEVSAIGFYHLLPVCEKMLLEVTNSSIEYIDLHPGS